MNPSQDGSQDCCEQLAEQARSRPSSAGVKGGGTAYGGSGRSAEASEDDARRARVELRLAVQVSGANPAISSGVRTGATTERRGRSMCASLPQIGSDPRLTPSLCL